ncbi:aldehyde dehydrogenase [Corynebacterium suranareeae]|uniref:Aldehyde dehydrogenase n=1 Tax=Corynebacterium suranareeae TaxID=2506452 RepID=A0A160PMC8_9CORY|nr:aldehyde dehydrogenase family protein [Corynebacterium suranareeae]BAU94414.1 aldehyde dehydrogenase [Corynebacterium suranareeae]
MTTTIRTSLNLESGLYINGAWTSPNNNKRIDVENPATEEVIGTVSNASIEDSNNAVAAARAAFDSGPWGKTTPEERKVVLEKFAAIMKERREELIELNIAECGSERGFAESAQVDGAIAHLQSTIDAMSSFNWEAPTAHHFGRGMGQGVVVREAFGVALLISAYNFPLWLNMTKLAPALAAGCSVILKPATTTPFEGLILAEIGEEAGLPPGVLNVITGGRESGKALSTHPDVDIISFTGSESVGKEVYHQGADTLKKVVLELGGKSPNIVFEDANLDAVAGAVIAATTKMAGQGCSLLTRTLVHNSVKDDLIARVKAGLESIKVGDPNDADTDMGPLISAAQRETVEDYIAVGINEGATLITGGKRPAGLDKGYFIEPTLFANVDNSMRIAQEEIFGPVNVIIAFDTTEEAIAMANDNPYGLAAGVNTADPARAFEIAKQLRSGQVALNGGGGSFPNTSIPFGGYKASGLGREYGAWGIDEYLETKAIHWGAGR